jgi:hypothetical protein
MDVLLYVFSVEMVKSLVDQVLDEGFLTARPPQRASGEGLDPGQVGLRLRWPSVDDGLPRLLLETFEPLARRACMGASVGFEALARGLGSLPSDAEQRSRLSLAYLGAEPACLHGGVFSIDPFQVVRHRRYGSLFEPTLPEVPVAGSPVTEAVGSLRELTTQVSFEGEGNHRGLRVQVRWQTR